jgi:hypothetical protein
MQPRLRLILIDNSSKWSILDRETGHYRHFDKKIFSEEVLEECIDAVHNLEKNHSNLCCKIIYNLLEKKKGELDKKK